VYSEGTTTTTDITSIEQMAALDRDAVANYKFSLPVNVCTWLFVPLTSWEEKTRTLGPREACVAKWYLTA
jgi:hypothetical protein